MSRSKYVMKIQEPRGLEGDRGYVAKFLLEKSSGSVVRCLDESQETKISGQSCRGGVLS